MQYEKFVTDKTFITIFTAEGATTFVADITNDYFVEFLKLTGFTETDVEALSPNVLTTYVGRQN